MKKIALALVAGFWLVGCSSPDPILPGVREPVFQESVVQIDSKTIENFPPKTDTKIVRFPNNTAHYAVSVITKKTLPKFERDWFRSIGSGFNSKSNHISQPVVGNGIFVTSDSIGNVRVWDLNTGVRLWEHHERTKAFAPGARVQLFNDVLIETKNDGEIIAFDLEAGKVLWEKNVKVPLHGPLSEEQNGYTYTVSEGNELYQINIKNGDVKKVFSGFPTTSKVIGTAGVAVDKHLIYLGLSTGEVLCFNTSTNQTEWVRGVYRSNIITGGYPLTDILGNVVSDSSSVYATGLGGELACLNKATGQKQWTVPIASAQAMWVMENIAWAVSTNQDLYAIDLKKGGIVYMTPLSDGEDSIMFYTPILISNNGQYQLWVFDNHGSVTIVDARDGKILGRRELTSSKLATAPVVADGKVEVVTESGTWMQFSIE